MGSRRASEPSTKTLASAAEAALAVDAPPDVTLTPAPGRNGGRTRVAMDQLARTRLEERFALDGVVGQGGGGVVHAAVQRSVGRSVAIKSLRAEERSIPREVKLLREAWLTASLEHPNVVPVHDVLVDEQRGPMVVLKRVQGVSWSEVIHDATRVRELFGEELLEFNLRVLIQVCHVISFAHSRGIVHRDIKPSNVMIGGFGEVYLLDWGIAVSLIPDPSGRLPLASDSLGMAGTPSFMAPEMLEVDGRSLSVRTDVYLLGAVLYCIVCGRPPHVGDAIAVAGSIARSTPIFEEPIAEELRGIIEKAMARDANDRHASADEVRIALQGFMRHRESMRLSDDAARRCEELHALFRQADANRDEVFRRYGECRFGLQAALGSWAHNQDAERLLARLLAGTVQHLLARGDAGAAAAIVAEHPGADPALRGRIAAALRERDQRAAALERLRSDLDPTIGRGVRRAALGAMGAVWTLAPWIAEAVDPHALPEFWSYANPVVLFTLAALVWYGARRSLDRTAINRRLLVAMLAGFCAHMVHVLNTQIAGLPAKSELFMGMATFGAIVAILAYTAEPRLWRLVPVYWLGSVVAARFQEQGAYVLSACNLVLTIYMVAIWGPRPRSGDSTGIRGAG